MTQYPQHRVPATRTTKLDDNLKQIFLMVAKVKHKEVAKIQAFALDAVSLLMSVGTRD